MSDFPPLSDHSFHLLLIFLVHSSFSYSFRESRARIESLLAAPCFSVHSGRAPLILWKSSTTLGIPTAAR